MEPLAPGRENYKYLEKCLMWLDFWKSCQPINHKLSNETHLAFSHSIYALLQLSEYCVNELEFNYILPGKIQTDSLEARFGKYRTMAGSQYLITIRQIFEVESKLRIQSLLPLCLNSDMFGKLEITLNDIVGCSNLESSDNNVALDSEVTELDFDISIDETEFANVSDVLPIIVYLSGYCARTVLKQISCNTCSNFLVIDKEILPDVDNDSYSLIKNIDRGRLLYPHYDVVNLVILNYKVINKLINNCNEHKYLKCKNQRQIAISITSKILSENSIVFNDFECNSSEHFVSNIIYYLLKISTNIFLNNYVKRKNDTVIACQKKKRKLNTLTQV